MWRGASTGVWGLYCTELHLVPDRPPLVSDALPAARGSTPWLQPPLRLSRAPADRSYLWFV